MQTYILMIIIIVVSFRLLWFGLMAWKIFFSHIQPNTFIYMNKYVELFSQFSSMNRYRHRPHHHHRNRLAVVILFTPKHYTFGNKLHNLMSAHKK